MKLSSAKVEALRNALHAAKLLSMDVVVITSTKILGANAACDAAIISDLDLGLPENARIGIGSGRIEELIKRLSLFGTDAEAELKINDRNDVVMITIIGGRSKIQFRCTSMALLERKYPQQNDDVPAVVVTVSTAEASQINRAVKSLSSETVVLKIERSGAVHIQCVDSTNDQFAIVLEKPADFVEEAEPIAFIFGASAFTDLVYEAAKGDGAELVIGQGGSLTATARSHTLLITQRASGE